MNWYPPEGRGGQGGKERGREGGDGRCIHTIVTTQLSKLWYVDDLLLAKVAEPAQPAFTHLCVNTHMHTRTHARTTLD